MKRFIEALFSIALALPIAASAASFTGDAWNAFEPASAADNVLRAATPVLTDQGACTDPYWEQFVTANNTDLSALTDGTVPQDATHGYAVRDNAVVSWTLAELSDIAEFRVYARWSGDGRSTVRIASIQVCHAADGEWETLPDSSVVSSGTAQRMAVYKADDGSAVATGVTAVRINFGLQDNGWNAYVEVEALKPADTGTGERLAVAKQSVHTTKYVMKNAYASVEEAYAAIAAYDAADPQTAGEAPWRYYTPNYCNGAAYAAADIYAGYLAWANGDFGAAFGGGDKIANYPGGYYEWNGNLVFGFEAPVQVPSAGTWTFSIYTKGGNSLSFVVTDSNGGTVFSELDHAFAGDDHWLVPVAFSAAGTYTVVVRQYSPSNGTWLELSEASGLRNTFSADSFVLLGFVPRTVTFDCGEGATTIAPVTLQDGNLLAEPEPPTKTGFAFVRWLKDGVAFDFATPVTEDMTLVAEWAGNTPPVITSASASQASVQMSGMSVAVTLSATATDADDGQTLSYAWEVVGDTPSPFALADAQSASTAVTLYGPGAYSFRVTVSDGFASVSEPVSVTVSLAANATIVTFAGYENSQGTVGYLGSTENPSNDDWPWGATNTGYKVAWRSTNAGNAANGGRKNLLLDARRPNAYGLDGYLFFGKDDAADVVTGTMSADGTSVSNVTDYVASFTLAEGTSRTGASTFWLDDPREPIGENVRDFKPGALSMPPGTFSLAGTIRFSQKISIHPVVRIGFLSAYGDHWKPYRIFVGTAGCVWQNRETDYGNLGWHFFDVTNAKPGDELMVWVDTTGCSWGSRIEGIVFDSKKRNGTVLIVR